MSIMVDAKEKWAGTINEVTIGAAKADGGSRTSVVTVGGASALPFMHFEGATPRKPVVAMEIWDREPDDWAQPLVDAFGTALKSPADWARKCVEEYGAELLCLKLAGTHPDFGDASPEQAAAVVKAVLKAAGVPLIIWGSDHDEKDNNVLPRCSQAAAGERCLIGAVKEDNYKTLVASCLADGHTIIGLSPIDINIAKQVNILVSEMGLPLNRIVMYPTTGALGYGIEYAQSIQERGRLAALGGDKIMSLPVICMVGSEAWRTKEAKGSLQENPAWGDEKTRGIYWEIGTAASLLQAGSDILVMRHPAAVTAIQKTISELMSK
ncbi:MAG: acetyl-CoA decarbonylase/synthase complex subunit delta [bacterium]